MLQKVCTRVSSHQLAWNRFCLLCRLCRPWPSLCLFRLCALAAALGVGFGRRRWRRVLVLFEERSRFSTRWCLPQHARSPATHGNLVVVAVGAGTLMLRYGSRLLEGRAGFLLCSLLTWRADCLGERRDARRCRRQARASRASESARWALESRAPAG